MLTLEHNDFIISLLDEPLYSLQSVDNIRTYHHEYILSDGSHFNAKHGLRLFVGNQLLNSCILFASGGATGIHPRSAIIIEDDIFMAVGNVACALSLPSLTLKWWQAVDFATCFGLYYLENQGCIITHGECDISRITRAGKLIWSTSGKDIFTEGFEMMDGYVKVIDFNHEEYHIRLEDGQIRLVSESHT